MYAGGETDSPTPLSVLGAKGRIKTRYAKLCCEGTSTSTAHSAAYVNVYTIFNDPLHDPPLYGTIWAQTGFGVKRFVGSIQPIQARYFEVQGTLTIPAFLFWDSYNAPAEGSTHSYAVKLQEKTGMWSCYQDGKMWASYGDIVWKDNTGISAQWIGEIAQPDDDMPGTIGNPCILSNCMYKVKGQPYKLAKFGSDSVIHSDNISLWGVAIINQTAIKIWDVNPQD